MATPGQSHNTGEGLPGGPCALLGSRKCSDRMVSTQTAPNTGVWEGVRLRCTFQDETRCDPVNLSFMWETTVPKPSGGNFAERRQFCWRQGGKERPGDLRNSPTAGSNRGTQPGHPPCGRRDKRSPAMRVDLSVEVWEWAGSVERWERTLAKRRPETEIAALVVQIPRCQHNKLMCNGVGWRSVCQSALHLPVPPPFPKKGPFNFTSLSLSTHRSDRTPHAPRKAENEYGRGRRNLSRNSHVRGDKIGPPVPSVRPAFPGAGEPIGGGIINYCRGQKRGGKCRESVEGGVTCGGWCVDLARGLDADGRDGADGSDADGDAGDGLSEDAGDSDGGRHAREGGVEQSGSFILLLFALGESGFSRGVA
ncbi:hypothetical protein BDK51DRAFT_32717 [Blyttiomyces helicus]|uniref:Uncharacterized protein n=1 Tax=Blyttiomyces helicus TaxID=388810 RepID=A0A4P9WN17_9FUNG|nr:hypothetical protein BDK51DRAFT_32717 [Blyttiomyces helicus]|eukprot:RKO94324.1 hypothetical protein BDK51DRAFT_32717 [Blyttiomyces helicus]